MLLLECRPGGGAGAAAAARRRVAGTGGRRCRRRSPPRRRRRRLPRAAAGDRWRRRRSKKRRPRWRGRCSTGARDGVESIALVALDRLARARARALLERAQVLVRDETGWKLSTTSAAAAVMRWYDLRRRRPVLARPARLAEVELHARRPADQGRRRSTPSSARSAPAAHCRARGAIRARAGRAPGARRQRRRLAPMRSPPPASVLGADRRAAAGAQRAGPTLAGAPARARAALDALGMRAGARRRSGRPRVLREIEALDADLAGVAGAGVAGRVPRPAGGALRGGGVRRRQVDSPVAMVSLAATALRPFDARAAHRRRCAAICRRRPAEALFMPNAVRARTGAGAPPSRELRAQGGAAGRAAGRHAARGGRLAQPRCGDEPNAAGAAAAACWQLVARARWRIGLLRPAERAGVRVPSRRKPRPAPVRRGAAAGPRLRPASAQALRRLPVPVLRPPPAAAERAGRRDRAAGQARLRRGAARGAATLPRRVGRGGVRRARCRGRWLPACAAHAERVFAPKIERGAGACSPFARRFDGLVDGYVDWLQQHAAEGWRWPRGERSAGRRLRRCPTGARSNCTAASTASTATPTAASRCSTTRRGRRAALSAVR
ncbi:MAG: hypothetical protein MZW92_25470 [Comamonadaceae bacterium]|nr:hypothetical protein [Comamonadaceae bacterium]